ncbi:TonB-dependent receptor [Halieaceae bacterium]|nr:TonB-dependent receptor [Halieaceae bacterium]
MKLSRNIAAGGAVMLAGQLSAQPLEELVVAAQRDTRTIDVVEALVVAPDVSRLLLQAPGANINTNGPITGIPQYRGLFGPRIAVSLDGNQLAPAGPNWMDPPLSYAVTAQLESLQVYRGIAPVSVAQESLGGAVDARTRHGEFGQQNDFELQGRVMGSAQTLSSGYQLDADVLLANRSQRFRFAAMTQSGDDASFPGGDILPTEYERQRYDLGYGVRFGGHTLQIDYGYNDTGDAGTPALPMDIEYFEGDLLGISYRFESAGALALEARLYGSDLDHGMTNFHLRPAPPASAWRQNIASSRNRGAELQALLTDDHGTWRVGIDAFREAHDSDIDNPKNPAFFVQNFNGAKREVLGAFLERGMQLGTRWRTELGLRYNHVSSDAGEVDGTPAMMMPPAQMLRDSFNAAQREQADDNVDLVAKAWFAASDSLSLYAGLSRKQRSPSYQERYLWLPLEATGGLADGQVYIGNLELQAERAHIAELGLDFADGRLSLSPRLFYNEVDDFIQGTPLGPMHPATMMVRMMNAANGTNRQDPLRFSNVDARLYGFDMDWSLRLDERWSLSGLVNHVRGERRDIADDLYRIAPSNATVRIDYSSGDWGLSLENVLYASQDRVSETNREKTTPGHGTVNLRGSWQVSPALQLAAGVDNLFDRDYQEHLGGYNRVQNPDIPIGSRLPGYGLNVFARVAYAF